jgi:hypothetical protein
MLEACPSVHVDPDPSSPPPRSPYSPQVKLKGMLPRIVAELEVSETVNALVRAAICRELQRRRAALAGEMADLDRADWSLLLRGAVL